MKLYKKFGFHLANSILISAAQMKVVFRNVSGEFSDHNENAVAKTSCTALFRESPGGHASLCLN